MPPTHFYPSLFIFLLDRKINLSLTDKAKDLLAERGFDPQYGARPLKRVIQRDIQDKLALKILEGEICEGDSVEVGVEDGEMAFKVTERVQE